MTEKMLKNRIEKLDAIAAQQKALEEQAEAIRNEIKVDSETALMCLGYNLVRAMNLLGFEKLMEAMA